MKLFSWRRNQVPVEMIDEPDELAPADQTAQDMTDMAVTLSDLKTEVALVNAAPANKFKPRGLLLTVAVFIVVATGTFFAVTELTNVDDNSKAIDKNCASRNAQTLEINKKFAQLDVLLDQAVANQLQPPTPEVLRTLAEFKVPIPPVKCEGI